MCPQGTGRQGAGVHASRRGIRRVVACLRLLPGPHRSGSRPLRSWKAVEHSEGTLASALGTCLLPDLPHASPLDRHPTLQQVTIWLLWVFCDPPLSCKMRGTMQISKRTIKKLKEKNGRSGGKDIALDTHLGERTFQNQLLCPRYRDNCQ